MFGRPTRLALAAIIASLGACGARPVPISGDLGPRCAWRAMPSPTKEVLYTVCGAAPDDVYAAGQNSALIHFDGAHWRGVSPPAGIGAKHMWASCRGDSLVLVGAGVGLLRGGQWSVLPDRPPDLGGWLRSAWISTSDQIYFGPSGVGLFAFEDGRWREASKQGRGMFGFAENGEGDIVSTGDDGWILHLAGSSWRRVPTSDHAYYPAAWASEIAFYIIAIHGRVLRYDGVVLEEVFNVPLQYSMVDLWGSGPNDLHVVGKGIWHFNGAVWSRALDYDGIRLQGVWGFGPEDVFAVGEAGRILHYSCRSE